MSWDKLHPFVRAVHCCLQVCKEWGLCWNCACSFAACSSSGCRLFKIKVSLVLRLIQYSYVAVVYLFFFLQFNCHLRNGFSFIFCNVCSHLWAQGILLCLCPWKHFIFLWSAAIPELNLLYLSSSAKHDTINKPKMNPALFGREGRIGNARKSTAVRYTH